MGGNTADAGWRWADAGWRSIAALALVVGWVGWLAWAFNPGSRAWGFASGLPALSTRQDPGALGGFAERPGEANAGLAKGWKAVQRAEAPGTANARLGNVSHPCGNAEGKPKVDRVLLIWEENHSYSSVIGNPAAPEINRLAKLCGVATNYTAVTHPSLPNYMSMTSGLSYAYPPWDDDCDPYGSCTTKAPSLFSELAAAGKGWRSYAESMVSNCSLLTYGNYAARHNPAVYYTSIRSQCRKWDQPLGTTQHGPLRAALHKGPTVAFTTVTPNVEDDMHNGTVGEADAWLGGWMPQIVTSPSYRSGHLAVVIAWDEGFGGGNEPSSAPLIVMSAYTRPGTSVSMPLNDYSVLRSISQLTGVRPLGEAAKAASFVRAFNL